MLKFTKLDSVKFIDEDSNLIPILLSDGWVNDDITASKEEDREELLEKAKGLGLKLHHKTGIEKIKEAIKEAENDKDSE